MIVYKVPPVYLVGKGANELQGAFPKASEAGGVEGRAVLWKKKHESCRSFHLPTISCGTWQTLDTIACRQRPGNPRSRLASLPSPIPEEL